MLPRKSTALELLGPRVLLLALGLGAACDSDSDDEGTDTTGTSTFDTTQDGGDESTSSSTDGTTTSSTGEAEGGVTTSTTSTTGAAEDTTGDAESDGSETDGSSDACANDINEPNDTPDDATPITNGEQLAGALCETEGTDLFVFDAPAGGFISLEAYFDGPTVDLDLEMLDADGDTVLWSSTGGTLQETIHQKAGTGGTRYARVTWVTGDPVEYELALDIF